MFVESMFDIVGMKNLLGFVAGWSLAITFVFFLVLYVFAKVTYAKEMRKRRANKVTKKVVARKPRNFDIEYKLDEKNMTLQEIKEVKSLFKNI